MFCLLTVGTRVTLSGLYKTQIIDLAASLKIYTNDIVIISFLPYFNRDLLRYKFGYEKYLQSIQKQLSNAGVDLRIVRLPLSSHFQFIHFKPFYYFWFNCFVLHYLRFLFTSYSIDHVYCRGLLASMMALKVNHPSVKCINHDVRGNDIEELPFFPFYSHRNKQQLRQYVAYAISKSTKTSCVNQVISRQLSLPDHKNLIYNLPSSLIANNLTSASSLSQHIKQISAQPNFLFIGSLGMTWYPFSEYLELYLKIKSLLPKAVFTILAPKFLHSNIYDFVSSNSLDVVSIDSFNDTESALRKTSACHFGIIPHISPQTYLLDYDLDITDLCAGVTSTKLSDYICLNLIPIVPAWCHAAADFVSTNNLGFIYGPTNQYNLSLIRDPNILADNLESIATIKQQCTLDSFTNKLYNHIYS